MSRKNTSSVDTTKGDKIARKSNENKNEIPVSFNQKEVSEQVINARKGSNVDLNKAKAKKKAKMAKASKKKNKPKKK
ncbi:hypothetical protein [Poseidonibacter lekithochrous]|uniref:hypothetical protein n=1 Tax=Poseidonibacter lekithochrous TaxID=1904463 RepID=UPI0008FC2C1E|nr:hypothetical protein [Poseidonibacter lekithochrous]QKJ23193.1 hypothetical protein ALEK_1930 [Poseidonibacter lekithochrous]